MYKNFKNLMVSSPEELKDPKRAKKLFFLNESGNIAAAVILSILGLVLSGGGIFLIAVCILPEDWIGNKILLDLRQPEIFWPLFLIAAFFGIMGIGMGRAFSKEVRLSPIPGFIKEPGRYIISEGIIDDYHYISGERHSGSKILAKGKFMNTVAQREQIFFEYFYSGCWKFIKKGAKEDLKPKDDLYQDKNSLRELPIKVWVLYDSRPPHHSALIGFRERMP